MRIVSLAPSATEMLYVLGLGGQLVGATDFCDWPPEAREVPRVGGLGAPNVERLLALAPDLVVATDFERDELADVLRESGIEVLEVKIASFEGLFEAFLAIGRATGKVARAEEAVGAMRARLGQAAERYEGLAAEQRKRVFVELVADPLMTVGGTSFVDEVIARAGGVNVAHDLAQPYPHINPEQVIAWNPDYVFLCYMTVEGEGAKQLSERIGWGQIRAVTEGNVIEDISPDLILRPGPRLVEGVEALAERLYGR
jgi:iron complex transport system substrate-binding protein